MKLLAKTLKDSDKVKSIYSTDDDKIILVENNIGTLFVINAKTFKHSSDGELETLGYQWSYPIKPNITTGSGMAGTGGYFEYISFDEMIDVVECAGYTIPNFYSENQLPTIKFYNSRMRDNLKDNSKRRGLSFFVLKYNNTK